MRAIILAAGRGSRMNELTSEAPKCMIELNGKTLLDWQISTLADAGITEIGVVTGYKEHLINDARIKKFYNARWNSTNMVFSLSCAEAWITKGPCIVSYSDIIYRAEAVQLLMSSNAELAITYDPNWNLLWEQRFENPLEDAEVFRLKDGKWLKEIGSKPKNKSEIEGQYMGLLRFSPQAWERVKNIWEALSSQRSDNIHMTDMLQLLINENKIKIEAIPYDGEWAEFDSPSDLKYAPKFY